MILNLSIKIDVEPGIDDKKVTVNIMFNREDTTGFINKEVKQRKYENVPIGVYESFIKSLDSKLEHEMLYFSLLLQNNFGIKYSKEG